MELRPIGTALQRLLSSERYAECRSLAELAERWEEVVGPVLSRLGRPLLLEGEALTLAVPDTVAASEVSFFQAQLREAVSRALGVQVREIRTRVLPPRGEERGEDASPTLDSTAAGTVPLDAVPLSAQEMEWIQEVSGQIRDPQLRERTRMLLQRYPPATKVGRDALPPPLTKGPVDS
ncbi:MAG: hypothetical protein KatS3mg115_2422 [Candidatus Poribacteria bacterium]|nr:MAG: hypothetical protein KatS3mg115_2422 [Candidatus Poribacteria bacterium]